MSALRQAHKRSFHTQRSLKLEKFDNSLTHDDCEDEGGRTESERQGTNNMITSPPVLRSQALFSTLNLDTAYTVLQ